MLKLSLLFIIRFCHISGIEAKQEEVEMPDIDIPTLHKVKAK